MSNPFTSLFGSSCNCQYSLFHPYEVRVEGYFDPQTLRQIADILDDQIRWHRKVSSVEEDETRCFLDRIFRDNPSGLALIDEPANEVPIKALLWDKAVLLGWVNDPGDDPGRSGRLTDAGRQTLGWTSEDKLPF
jgi:hypothetical protein